MKFFNKRHLLIILPILFLFLTIGVFLNFSKSENLNYLNLFRNISKENPKLETQKVVEIKTNPTKKLVFLMYHYVEINKNKDDFKRDSLNTLPEIFEKQILTLKDAGYKFIFPSEIYQFLRDESNQKYAVISFDDGYETFYTYTYPILKKHRVKSVNYIIYNFIGNSNNMNEAQIKNLAAEGLVEIGSHTLNHLDLTSISKEQLRNEIILSKDLLEKRFDIKVTSFCYPYGFFNEESFPFLKEAGYLTAVTTKEGSLVSEDSLFEIKRIRPGILTGDSLVRYLEEIN